MRVLRTQSLVDPPALRRESRPRRAATSARAPGLAIGVMCAAFVAYIVLHTPLRNEIAGLIDIGNRSCYLCAHSLTGRDIADSIAAATLLLLAVAGGWMLAIRCAFPSYEKVLVFGVATIGLVTVPAAAIAGLASLLNGTYLRAPVGPLLAAIPAGIVVAAAVRDGRKFRMGLTTEGFPTPLLLFAAAAAGAMFVAATALSLGHPPTQGDALSYHAPLGVLFWSDGNLTAPLDRAPVFFALANPGTAELWNGLLRLIGGERLADLGQLPFALLGSSAVYAFTRRTGLLGGSALLAACAFLLMPIVALQMGTQADDVAGAALVMTAIALASAPTDQWDDKRLATLGLALGLAATTKLALLPSVAAVAVFMLGAGIRDHGRARRRIGAVAVASFVVMFVVAVAPWWARNIAREGNPVFPQGLPLVGHGFNIGGFGRIDTEFVPRPAAWPLYPLVEPIDDRSGFGVLFALGLIPGLVLAVRRARRQPLLLYFLGILITLPVWWGYTDHEPRFLLPYAGLGLAFLPWALLAVPRGSRGFAIALLVGATIFSIVVTVDQGIVPLGRQPVERAAFYDRVWGVDPAAVSLPEMEGILANTGFGLARIDYASYYPLLGPSNKRLVVLLDASEIRRSTAVIVRRMRKAGVRYAYVVALPRLRRVVERLYGGNEFKLVHSSTIVPGARLGARRTVFRQATRAELARGLRRYLFRLRGGAS